MNPDVSPGVSPGLSSDLTTPNPESLPQRTPAVWDGAAEALPGVARIATSAWARSAVWSVGTGLRAGRLAARVITKPSTAGAVVQELAKDVATATKTVSQVATAVAAGVPVSKALAEGGAQLAQLMPTGSLELESREEGRELTLREKGERLLQRSRDVWNDEKGHPAYARILDEIAPDEARILVLLLRGGPQPSVDVRTGGPIGMVSSQLIAGGLNMIGPRAGVRFLEDVHAYLNNLNRLGLVWFSREQLEDPHEYQVVEAQPDVLAAMHSTRFPKMVRRSIHLTPFGVDFCRTCLVDPQDQHDLPEQGLPEED